VSAQTGPEPHIISTDGHGCEQPCPKALFSPDMPRKYLTSANTVVDLAALEVTLSNNQRLCGVVFGPME